jgi:hypothetical protein
MSIAVPQLDTSDFESLLEEARGRISRYAPEWTDHNLHDPGITLLELLAWVTDQQIYQLGFVGDAYYRAFARLLGVTPELARPARGLLWPQAPIPVELDLPLATRATALDRAEVPFLIDLACRLSTAQRVGLVRVSERGSVSLLATDRRERASFPAYREADDDAFWMRLRFDRPILGQGSGGAPTGIVSLGIEIEKPALAPGSPPDGVPVWGPLGFEYRVAGGIWRPLRRARDDTLALLQSGIVALEIPAVAGADPTELRLRLDRGFFPSAPRIARIGLNVLPIVQLEQRAEALLAAGTGLPDQTRELPLRGLTASSPVVAPLEIDVVGADGWERWRAADALRDLGPDDRRVKIDSDREFVRFGNGINGQIPPLGAQIRHSTYALTRGSDGNVRSGLNWRVDCQGGVLWTNRVGLAGGEDAWDGARLSLEARRRARHPVVSVKDVATRAELLALPGFALARVEILARHHPAVPDEQLPGHRTFVVVPEIMRRRDLTPDEARRYVDALRARLDPRRLAGERQHIVLARCVPVRVRARLLIEPGAPAEKVRAAAEAALAAQLAPLQPEGQPDDRRWSLGRMLSIGRLEGLLADLDQVVAVTALELARDEGGFAASPILLEAIELPRLRDAEIKLELSSGA